ncbi:MAG: YMGG-like glycine zipper-containing protein [Chthoniobacter sp.]
MRTKIFCSLLLTASLGFTGCETAGPGERSGTLLGAAGGAGLGAIIGNNVKGMNSWEGALAGAAVGGLVGNRMGKQKDEINTLKSQAHTTTIYVKNKNGSSTPVMIRQIGANKFQGPRGEIYNGFPTKSQLASMYAI